MSNPVLAISAFAVATAAASWLLVGLLVRWAPRLGLLDRPNARSSHTCVTPRGGGIGFVLAIALALAGWAALASGVMAERGERTTEDVQQRTDDGGRRTEDGRQTADAGGLSRNPDAFRYGRTAGGGDETLTRSATGSGISPSSVLCPQLSGFPPVKLLTVLGAALFIAAISLRDDFRSLGAGLRFACHFAAAGLMVGALDPLARFAVPLLGDWTLPPGIAIAVTVVWIVGLTNVYNFMDGIDGIAGVQGLVAGLAWLLVGLASHASVTALLGAVLAGGCAGFLRHNWAPARIFMGDVGSAFLGFLFAVVPLVAARERPECAGYWPLFAGLAVWPFVGDGFLTFLRRLRHGEKVWEAHRSHLYQRLTQSGWSHAAVSSLYALWAVAMAGIAGLWCGGASGAGWLVWLLPPGSLAALFVFVSRRERAVRDSR